MDPAIRARGREVFDALTTEEQARVAAWVAPDQPLDGLLEELGRQRGGLKAMGEDPVERGRNVVENLSPTIKGAVCGSVTLRAYADGSNADTGDLINAAGAVTALLAPALGAGVTTFLLAVIVLRIGLRQFCGAQWNR